MSELVARLREQSEKKRLQAGERYRGLLLKESLTGAEETELLQCLQMLGRDIDVVPDDAALLYKADELKAAVSAGAAGLAAERGYRAAIHDAECEHASAFAKANADLEARRKEIGQQYSNRAAAITARNAERELSTLYGELASAFGSDNAWRVKMGA